LKARFPEKELDMRKTLMLGAAALALAIAPAYAGPGDDADQGRIQLVQDRTAPGTPGTTPPANRGADEAQRQRQERLSSAQPAQQMAVSADAVMGTEIRNTQDQKIGSVKDLVMQDGKITAIIVARGGVLGMGTDYHQVEWSQVKMTADMETIVLDLSEDQVKALPKMTYEKGKWGPAPVSDRDRGRDTTQPPARTTPGSPPATAPGAPPSGSTPAPAERAPADKPAEEKKD
jgi:sporulation protein YlmC with PRC-barrel domain